MGIFSSDDDLSGNMDASPQGDHVTEKRVKKMGDVIDDDEPVHYMTAGSTIDVAGDESGTSLFGNDRGRKSGTKGYVRTAFTDTRAAIKIPQLTGTDERSVPYQNITSIDLDTGLLKKRLSLKTNSQAYHIEIDKPGKDECREIVKFLRDKVEESQQTTVSSSEPDPTEQLQRLKELHDDGVLSDEEFEEKKEELLDKI